MGKLKGILFDLDGTLLPMDLSTFTRAYFGLLIQYLITHGYQKEKVEEALGKGVTCMMANDGSKTNETAFWQVFHGIISQRNDETAIFETFYNTEFGKLRDVCGFDARAALCVQKAREKADKVILATNPLFPLTATEQRAAWAGCPASLFDYVTSFEHASFSKPNLNYYKKILTKEKLNAEDCLMIGNNVDEDILAAKKAGMDTYLLTDCLIGDPTASPDAKQGNFAELLRFLESL